MKKDSSEISEESLSVSKKWLRPLFRVFARGWRSASAPILRSRAGPVVRRKAKKVWPSGHRTKESMAVRTPDQRKYGRPATGPAGRPALEKCKKPRTGRGFLRIDRGRADDSFRYIGFSTVLAVGQCPQLRRFVICYLFYRIAQAHVLTPDPYCNI